MNFVKDDFAYYRRSFEQMYRSYFQRRMIVVGIALLIICAYLALIQEGFLLNLFLIAVLLVLFSWLYLRWQEVDQIIAEFEQENSEPIIYQIVEFEDYYAAKNKNGQQVRIKKNGNRNFPSANKTYTLMAGFKKAFFPKQPLFIFYYDMLENTYDEAYRIRRNGQTTFSKWSRYFSFRSFRASIGNGFRFILGNLFFLFLIYRLIRYLISLLRMFIQ